MKTKTLLIISAITLLLTACFKPEILKQEKVFFEQHIANNTAIERLTLNVDGNELFYAAAGDPQKPSLIIIHGTPGNWEQYARYLLDESLKQSFYVIVLDRPGWGASNLANDEIVTSFTEQAKILAALSDQLKAQNNNQAVILMGHSLGASIAPRVAMDYPKSIDGLLLFAGSLDPNLGVPRWYNRAAEYWAIQWMIGKRLAKANLEIFILRDELQTMASRWSDLEIPTLVVQGTADSLVYPANANFAREKMNQEYTEVIELDGEGHLFPMSMRKEVVAWSECVLQKIRTPSTRCQD